MEPLMSKKIICTDKNQRELNQTLSGRFPVSVGHDRLFDYIKQRVLFHWHPELEIAVVKEGSLICQVNDIPYTLNPGEGIFINTNVLHAYFPANENDCIYKAVRFDPTLFGQPGSSIYEDYILPVLSNSLLCSILLTDAPWQKEISSSVMEIARLDLENDACLELRILEQLTKLWALLHENTIKTISKKSQSARDITRMKQAMTYIQNVYQTPVTLEAIAASCSLSQSECCRLFKRILHQSPMEYVISVRISRSLSLLSGGTLSITEIAGMTGFQSSSYFTETFRKLTGMTPTQYRKGIYQD